MSVNNVKKIIGLNIGIGVITVVYVTYVLLNFKYYLKNALFFDIIAIILGFMFAFTMALWVVKMPKSGSS
ncbi:MULTISPECIES: hypothetical protein [Acidiplasma]|jgi:hypothetical protein|uniref:Uncharacterized protein n=2 Tax=Acidiplasma TaxID=507753 RepID=A0A0Q0VP28_9ARCH|nr:MULTISPECIES: hypothetical protein [Acidiplasma]KJE49902.1 hypothetical protein TZ01_02145 [Acidiplasma sp. MBA-1]KQB35360.1 hypothetical protein AOG55_06980 [Acidiplasma cupricumulans]KQB35595.1 hypothetical protein AOG54_00530 [Acidiplasma aeolicum]WMT55081.1 MAG: hypothetical protein RE470_00180 [Acidiplasma sp.]